MKKMKNKTFKKLITAYLLTISLITSSVVVPLFFKYLRDHYYNNPDVPLTHEWVGVVILIGYVVITIAAWVRVFNNNDKWF